jgi:hypothetical protein
MEGVRNDETLGAYVLRPFRGLGVAGSLWRLECELSAAALRSSNASCAGQIVDEPAGQQEINAALRFGV